MIKSIKTDGRKYEAPAVETIQLGTSEGILSASEHGSINDLTSDPWEELS